jgi:hypothetical protein
MDNYPAIRAKDDNKTYIKEPLNLPEELEELYYDTSL